MEKGEEAIAAAETVEVKLEYHEDHQIDKDVIVEEEKVCSLCGDIGFKNSLLLCKKCGFRFQHSYCSRLYPDIDMKKWSCEWCLHEQQQQQHHKQMDAVVALAAAATATATAVDDYEFGRNNKRNKKMKRQRSNSKVFEFLLDIADQSSPVAEKHTKLESAKQQLQKTNTVCVRNDDKRSIISSPFSEEKVMKRSSSSLSSFGYNKRKFEDIGLESPTTPTSTAATTTTSSTSTRSVAAAAEMLKRDDHHVELSNRRFHKTAVTKNKSNNNNNNNNGKAALDRWRNLAANKNKLGCRRYKLLADVHC